MQQKEQQFFYLSFSFYFIYLFRKGNSRILYVFECVLFFILFFFFFFVLIEKYFKLSKKKNIQLTHEKKIIKMPPAKFFFCFQ